MNRLLIGSVALAAIGLGGSAALAADMRARPVVAPPAVYSWTGCYVGLDGGTSYGKTDGYTTTAGSATTVPLGQPPGTALAVFPGFGSQPFNLSGFIGGVYAGCNVQFGWWVLGFEGDWSKTNKEGQAFPTVASIIGPVTVIPGTTFNPADNWHLQERWLATARARLGFTPWDKSLLYVTGGAAWARFDSTESIIGAPNLFTIPIIANTVIQRDTRTGWTVGGGWEYALGYGWLIRSEYLYVQFKDYTTFTGAFAGGTGFVSNLNVAKPRDHIFRFGMAYKFW